MKAKLKYVSRKVDKEANLEYHKNKNSQARKLICKYCNHRITSHIDEKGNISFCSRCDCSSYSNPNFRSVR